MTVFLTTHYMEEANKADLVVVIDKGKIVAQDTPHNLKAQFSSDYIKAYMPKNDEFERAFAKFLEEQSAEQTNQKKQNGRNAALQKEAGQQAQNAENDEMDAKSEFKYDLQYCGDFYQLKVKDSAHAFEIINKFKRYITDFEILKGDMDDVFLNITGKSLNGPHESKTE